MRKRMKASEVSNSIEHFMPRKRVPFAEVFPQIEDLEVQIIERAYGPNSPRCYSAQSIDDFINCKNPICYNGGFCLTDIIRQMIPEKKTELITTRSCQGYEGSPKGRRKYRSCACSFEITVKIRYKAYD